TYVHGGKIGVMVEVNSETDFVAKNEEFIGFAHDVALQIASMAPESVEALLEQPFIKEPSKTMRDLLHDMVGKIGENLSIRRFIRYELGGE
ncbi:MAG: elongation factor Ts, partial [Patescibacteria group bacterium]